MWIKVNGLFFRDPSKPHTHRLSRQGGNAIWGNGSHAPDDPDNCTQSHGQFFSFRTTGVQSQVDPESNTVALGGWDTNNMTADEAGTWVLEHTPVTFQVRPIIVVMN